MLYSIKVNVIFHPGYDSGVVVCGTHKHKVVGLFYNAGRCFLRKHTSTVHEHKTLLQNLKCGWVCTYYRCIKSLSFRGELLVLSVRATDNDNACPEYTILSYPQRPRR